MRLKNKKTGEIVEFRYLQTDYVAPLVLTICKNDKPEMNSYTSLAELNSEWEDVEEEPKGYWYIGNSGLVHKEKTNLHSEAREAIGNRFGSPEEAEKAVEKLRAWKRLKDKGFRLSAVVDNTFFCLDIFMKGESYEAIKDDLKIIFGGEE